MSGKYSFLSSSSEDDTSQLGSPDGFVLFKCGLVSITTITYSLFYFAVPLDPVTSSVLSLCTFCVAVCVPRPAFVTFMLLGSVMTAANSSWRTSSLATVRSWSALLACT